MKKRDIINIILWIAIIWFNVTSFICWVKNPKLTKMEVFLRTPKSFILDFEQENP